MSEPRAVAQEGTLRSSSSRFKRAFGTTAVITGFAYAAQLLSLVALPLYLTTLGAGNYGLMVTVMALMGYLSFADAGLSWGSMILIAQASGRGSKSEVALVVRHSIVLAFGSGMVVVLALAAILVSAHLGWRLPMFAGHPEADRLTAIAGIQLALTLQLSVIYNLFQGLQEGYVAGVYQGLARLLGVAGSMVAAWKTQSVAAVMIVQFGFAIAGGIAALIHALVRHPWAFAPGSFTDRGQYASQIRVGAKSFLLQIGRTLGSTAPTFGIGSVFGPAAVPLYTVPLTLLGAFFGPINTWNASMQSAYGEAWTSGATDWARDAFRKTVERTLLFGGAGVALFLALGDPFIRFWTHGRLSLSAAMAVSVTLISVAGTLVLGSEYLLTGLNRHRRASIAQICNGAVAMVLVPLFARWAGMGSVGLAVVGSTLLTSGWVLPMEIHARLGPGCFPQVPYVLRILAALAVGSAAGAWAGHTVSPETATLLLRLLLGAGAGLAAYGATALALGILPRSDLSALRNRLARAMPSRTP